ncbi:hypothetical protein I41_11370 [Lacipirellula limnantheis]|uniref:Uncharacterized protein n=1 Tax=Lacipirellula limnantheis TaxID=2528024 RepID=A0A517TUB4_9BACT|nr:hypothetical protein I41_11370 [Lacipirellula limnantheis]
MDREMCEPKVLSGEHLPLGCRSVLTIQPSGWEVGSPRGFFGHLDKRILIDARVRLEVRWTGR